ncbi:MAG: hypothetical protein IPO08_22845 [Xanthomonadales bacterium]|nr:hypothetical protein [Xanthomonadales bacterium]
MTNLAITDKQVEILGETFTAVRNLDELAAVHGDWIKLRQNSLRWPREYPCLTRGEKADNGYAITYLCESDIRELRDTLSFLLGDTETTHEQED